MARPATHAQRMAYVDSRMKALGKGRTQKALEVGREGGPDLISGELLIALATRESGLRNVLGDYTKDKKHAHARGAFQIHDKYHAEFLRSVPGCLAARWIPEATKANWVPVKGTNALMRWMCPTWEDGARYAAKVLNGYIHQARRAGLAIHSGDVLKVAVAAYNTGPEEALRGYREGDADRYTTGSGGGPGDYSRDVLRRADEVREWLRAHPNWRP